MHDRIILALDFSTYEEMDRIITVLPDLRWVKVGMQLFFSLGEDAFYYLKSKHLKIFLDLKLLDIPNTVHQAINALNELPVDLISVHASGGSEMLRAAQDASKIPLVAITCLTSIGPSELSNELKVQATLDNYVLSLAELAKNSGINHLVCSPLELDAVKGRFGNYFTLITPGIRKSQQNEDQVRVMDPATALSKGADFLVVGREISASPDPLMAFRELSSL
jgi:orotidine-5'-phosphate decarboxylase